jgi:hypothetical protein
LVLIQVMLPEFWAGKASQNADSGRVHIQRYGRDLRLHTGAGLQRPETGRHCLKEHPRSLGHQF